METSKPPTKAIVGLIVVVLLAVAATAVIVSVNGSKSTVSDTTASTSTSPLASSSASTSTTSSSTTYKDGTYSATGSYSTPGGQESITVSVTVSSDGTITDSTVKQNATSGEAQEFQSDFVSGYKSQVVGKKISEVNLSRVSGSSLTPIGFNNAINQIESQATA